ncbi:MAG TPA: hypothetical protein VJ397_01185, partial [Thermoplasmata archaeon]|nr:hypothetical protein [Thermoplasmata archaeon]
MGSITLALVLGTPLLAPSAAALSWAIEDVNSGSLVDGSRLSLDSSGAAHVVYYDLGNLSLVYGEKVGLNWVLKVVLGVPTHEARFDLAVDGLDRPHVAYFDNATNEVWYAVRDGLNWTEQFVDSAVDGGSASISLALDSLSRPHMVYQVGPVGSMIVRYTYWNGTAWHKETVDAGPNFGGRICVALDAQDVAQVIYSTQGSSPEALRYARRNGTSWDAEVIASNNAMMDFSMDLDWAGTPHVAFNDFDGGSTFDLNHAWRRAPGDWPAEVVDAPVASWIALALDPIGRPHISYSMRGSAELRHAWSNGTAWQAEAVAQPAQLNDLEVDPQGRVHLTFTAQSVLKYAVGSPPVPHPRSWIADVSPYWRNTAPLNLVAWVEPPTGATVDLHYRFDGGSGWGPWTFFASDSTGPWAWAFPFPDGEGRYEFYSIAFDGREWELQPPLADTAAGYDTTPPVSSASPISPYWWDTPS